MKGFSREVKQLVYRGQNAYCYNCTGPIQDYHHRIANTKTNQKLYPLFINSIFNCAGLCRRCHENMTWRIRISNDMALVYEEWLRGRNK